MRGNGGSDVINGGRRSRPAARRLGQGQRSGARAAALPLRQRRRRQVKGGANNDRAAAGGGTDSFSSCEFAKQ